MILLLTAAPVRTWPWADGVIFWGLNLGAASFIAVLLGVGSGYNSGPFQHPVAELPNDPRARAALDLASRQTR